MAGIAIPQVERRVRRNIEKLRVLLLAFDARVDPGQRIVEIVAEVAPSAPG